MKYVNAGLIPDQLQMAEIDYLPEYPDTPALQGHDALASLLKPIFPELQKQYGYDKPNYGSASWVLGRLVEILPAPLSLKTELLAFDDPNEALDHLQEALDRSDQQPTSRRF